MAYDIQLEDRIDKLISTRDIPLTKKKMFGGLGYFVNGNMCFGIHKDELIVRTDEQKAEDLLKKPGIRPFDMTKRPMKTWLLAANKVVKEDESLTALLEFGRDYALSLPPK